MVTRLKNLSSPRSKLALSDFQLTLLKQVSELSIMPVDMDRLLNMMMNLVLQMMQVESGSIISDRHPACPEMRGGSIREMRLKMSS